MALLGSDMVAFCRCLRRSVLVFPLAVEMDFRRSVWSDFFLVGRDIGTSSKRNCAI